MFTGLVESTGTLTSFEESPGGRIFRVNAPGLAPHLATGESLAVNGCCLTAVATAGSEIRFDLLAETLARTNLGQLKPGDRLNFERALAANARLGGHFVQGHIDDTTTVSAIDHQGPDLGLTFALPPQYAAYLIPKGSIAINGVSLTVAHLSKDAFTVWIIPHTRQATNLGELEVGDAVNLEFDVLAKYVARLVETRLPLPGSRI